MLPEQKIKILTDEGEVEEQVIQLEQLCPYSCNKSQKGYSLDLLDGHVLPYTERQARIYIARSIRFDILNSYDVIKVLEPFMRKHGKEGLYRKLPFIPHETQKYRLENNDAFVKALVQEYGFERYM